MHHAAFLFDLHSQPAATGPLAMQPSTGIPEELQRMERFTSLFGDALDFGIWRSGLDDSPRCSRSSGHRMIDRTLWHIDSAWTRSARSSMRACPMTFCRPFVPNGSPRAFRSNALRLERLPCEGNESGKLLGRSHADEDVPRPNGLLWRRVGEKATVGAPDGQHQCAGTIAQMS